MTRDNGDMQPTSLGPLFDTPERNLSHTTDPQTSREAARGIQSALGKEQDFALQMVERYPGSTAPELGQSAVLRYGHHDKEWWRQRIGRRLNELKKAGRIYRSGRRDGCATWRTTNR